MTTQSEQTLEDSLIVQLQKMKYGRVVIVDEQDLAANLKIQLETHNHTTFSDAEFGRILNHLTKGNVFDRAKTLRDKMRLVRDDGTNFYVEFFNQREWCQNHFQVTNQVNVQGSYKNRYDVTILINGLPLVQIELKRRGLELKEAFNQTQRYHKHSYSAGLGLFMYVQLFVISNGVNTKYYANNYGQTFDFTSFWTDVENNKISELSAFAEVFLDPCHVAKMIARYIVLTEKRIPKVLRPYQYHAVEAVVDKVRNSTKGGYIWHTTGSGKTLTSFKASQIITELPDVYKVVFVVDRNDLDTQTIREFNEFQKDSVDQNDSTRELVKRFVNPDNKLIVTTIQKLNNAVTNERHLLKMDQHRDQKIVFIFDECHRSQFGKTHKRITEYFTNHQLFGFTGTPIFKDNASMGEFGKRTTRDLFGEPLHRYMITDAINDENVLKFMVEYVGRYKQKGTVNEIDVEVEAIDTKELMESPQRLDKIADYVLANHDRKTHSREFNAIFAISNIDVLSKYYEIFKGKQASRESRLKIATIFSYAANEDDNVNGLLDEDVQLNLFDKVNQHSRDKLESYIVDYNKMFGTNYTTKDSVSFYNYYRDIAKRVRSREIDILLVVNMFLTGFDSPMLNTLYVDKNLRYHGLLQAYSRTNRIAGEIKPQGNIVAFRNLRKATNEALKLFANKDAEEIIFTKPYDDYLVEMQRALVQLRKIAADPQAVDDLMGEQQKVDFVKAFREVMRLKNTLSSFGDFALAGVDIDAQEFADYKSKYLDIYDSVQRNREKEKVSILEDVDFVLELIKRDEINVDYILHLLASLVDASDEQREILTKNILTTVSAEPALRSKRELIERFIKSTIPKITDPDTVEEEFQTFWAEEKTKAFEQMRRDEGLVADGLQRLIDDYLYTGRKPRSNDIVEVLEVKPLILERPSIVKRITQKLSDFIQTFIEGV